MGTFSSLIQFAMAIAERNNKAPSAPVVEVMVHFPQCLNLSQWPSDSQIYKNDWTHLFKVTSGGNQSLASALAMKVK